MIETDDKEIVIENRVIVSTSLWILGLMAVLTFCPFTFVWSLKAFLSGGHIFLRWMLLVIFVMVLLHEGLHGLCWALCAKKKFKSVVFGFNKEYLSPYTHCKEPLSKYHYLIGGLAPLFIMGIVPFIYGYLVGNACYLIFGSVNIWASSGDIVSCWYIFKYPVGCMFQDHPDSLGFIVKYANPA